MKKSVVVTTTVAALSAVAFLWSTPATQAAVAAAAKPKLTCLHYETIGLEPGPSQNGICLRYKNKYAKNS